MKTTITSQKMIQLKDSNSMTMMNSFKMTRRKTLRTFHIIVQTLNSVSGASSMQEDLPSLT